MKIDAGKEAPDIVNAVIEIPMGTDVKYEYDPEKQLMKVDRILFTAMCYPMNYGFIPGTAGGDGDPLDILVMCDRPLLSGSYIEVRPVGVLNMQDEEGEDFKIIAVPKAKVSQTQIAINDIKDIPEATLKKVIHFFEHMKELEPNKWVKVTGWESASDAKAKIKAAMKKK